MKTKEITKQQYENAITEMDNIVTKLIEDNDYEGLRDQDGFEVLELTVRGNHRAETTELILGKLGFYSKT